MKKRNSLRQRELNPFSVELLGTLSSRPTVFDRIQEEKGKRGELPIAPAGMLAELPKGDSLEEARRSFRKPVLLILISLFVIGGITLLYFFSPSFVGKAIQGNACPYQVNENTVLPANIASQGFVANLPCPANTAGIVITANDIMLDCNGKTIYGTFPTGSGISVNGKRGITIKNCRVSGFREGLLLSNVDDAQIENNVLNGNVVGIRLPAESGSTGNTFRGNVVYSNRQEGFKIESGSNNNQFWANEANKNDRGIHIEFSNDIVFEQNILSGNNESGLWMHSSTLTSLDNNVACANENDIECGTNLVLSSATDNLFDENNLGCGNLLVKEVNYDLCEDIPSASYPFTVDRNGQLNDVSSGLSGTILGTVDCTIPGISGTSCSFPRDIQSALSLPHSILNRRNDFSLSFWMKTASQNDAIISVANSDQANEFLVSVTPYRNNQYELGFDVFVKNRRYSFSSLPLLTINDNRWHHLIITRSGSSGEVVIYVDGQQLEQTVAPTPLITGPLVVDENGFIIGQDQDSLGGGFQINQAYQGVLDSLKVYHFVLTPHQAAFFFAQERSACGNGRVEGDEQCDDGNVINDDQCQNSCTLPAVQAAAAVPPDFATALFQYYTPACGIDGNNNNDRCDPYENMLTCAQDCLTCPLGDGLCIGDGITDSDHDGLSDAYEGRLEADMLTLTGLSPDRWFFYNPNAADTDGDGVGDNLDYCPGTQTSDGARTMSTGFIGANGCHTGDMSSGVADQAGQPIRPDGCYTFEDFNYEFSNYKICPFSLKS